MTQKKRKKSIKRVLLGALIALGLWAGALTATGTAVYAKLPAAATCTTHATSDHAQLTESYESGTTVKVNVYIEEHELEILNTDISTASFATGSLTTASAGTWFYVDATDSKYKKCDGHGDSQHKHGSWKYTADGETITAECKADGDCMLTNKKISLTLTASDATYSGNPVSATLSGTTEWEAAGLTLPTISYVGTDGTTYDSESAPKEVGSYIATIAVDKAMVHVDFEITKKPGPAAPNATGVKPSTAGGNDGKITGVDTTMEYSLDDGKTWSAVTGTEITGLSAGTVSVRVKENDTTFAGEIAKVVVPDGDVAAKPEEVKPEETQKETSYNIYTKKSTVTVPKTTTKNGVTYTVTSLKKNAFDGKYVKKVVLPSTITKISSGAFSKDNKLRSIKITSKKLTVAKNAFKGIKKKNRAKIKVTVSKKMSKKNFKALKKNLVKQGLQSKNIVRK